MMLPIIDNYRSHNNRSRGGSPVSLLVLHYTVDDFSRTMQGFLYGGLSVNYVIDEKPAAIYRLVPEYLAAFHAGVGKWQDFANINNASIGIELVNQTRDIEGVPPLVGWVPFEPKQIQALIPLMQEIIARYKIDATCVIGHSDSAGVDVQTQALRKVDPGPLFPWEELHRHGIGAWPEPADVKAFEETADPGDVKNLQIKLQRYGYDIQLTGVLDVQTQSFVRAFKLHFNPEQDSKGQVDGSISKRTVAVLEALVKKYRAKT
jgi:N-acetylmuramoyl-L-alanine amidase